MPVEEALLGWCAQKQEAEGRSKSRLLPQPSISLSTCNCQGLVRASWQSREVVCILSAPASQSRVQKEKVGSKDKKEPNNYHSHLPGSDHCFLFLCFVSNPSPRLKSSAFKISSTSACSSPSRHCHPLAQTTIVKGG